MPDDLLRHVIGPTPYSSWWLWAAGASLLVLAVGYSAILLATMPARRLREIPLVGSVRDSVLRRRFAHAVRGIAERYRSGHLAAAGAGAAVSGELRAFLRHSTGLPVEFMQLDELTEGVLAPASTVLGLLNDVQFNPASQVDVGAVADSAEELIRSWT